jgi:hypothetical protein
MPEWFWSGLVLLGAGALFFFARHRASQPADPLNVRLVDYTLIQMVALVAGIVALTMTIFFVAGNHIAGRLGALETVTVIELS